MSFGVFLVTQAHSLATRALTKQTLGAVSAGMVHSYHEHAVHRGGCRC